MTENSSSENARPLLSRRYKETIEQLNNNEQNSKDIIRNQACTMDQEGVEIESKTKNVTHPLGNLNYKELRDLTRREISNFLVSKKDPNRSSLMGSTYFQLPIYHDQFHIEVTIDLLRLFLKNLIIYVAESNLKLLFFSSSFNLVPFLKYK